jgi:hypothetical protein
MVGLGAGALCLLPMFFVPVGLPLVWIEILFALASIGVGTVFPISMVSVQNSVVVHQLGTATATVSFMRNFGSAIGVAIFGTVVISGGISRDHAADAIVTSAQFNEVFRWVFLIGAIGLVENMPDGNAQRPGDIVKTMSGQTVEVINTDAEGRLVLADVLWYVQHKYQPGFMINLATLTGAILVALGKEYAGLFSNNDELSARLSAAGQATGEKVWRMPMGPAYDKMLDSQFADMKNIGGRNAGSITAAQFLQRFVNETPWAHLDIAGTAMGSPESDINKSWGSGWGVRLLDRFVVDYYEG